MSVYYQDDLITLHHGDCVEVLQTLPDGSVDAVVTDPPYNLTFMGRQWDNHHTPQDFQDWCELWAVECLRVLKPGGHMLAFGGSRTWHRLASAVEDCGFEVRDSIAWLYGSGFPKSLDVSKAIDKGSGQNRERQFQFTEWMRSTGITARQIDDLTGTRMGSHFTTHPTQPAIATAELFDKLRPILPKVPEHVERLVAERTGINWTDYVRRKKVGERTGLPDARKVAPGFAGRTYNQESAVGSTRTVDVTEPATSQSRQWDGWGTALKPAFEPIVVGRKPLTGTVAANVLEHGTGAINIDGSRVGPGRWPTNVLLDESQAKSLDDQTAVTTSTIGKPRGTHKKGMFANSEFNLVGAEYDDHGGASRFFPTFRYEAKAPSNQRPEVDGVQHPTVKPVALMQWLVRLVTPPGGLVLDPFAGSGTTGEACASEGFNCLLIERETDYLPLIKQRLSKPIQTGLDIA